MKTSDISVECIDYCGSDLSVVNAARVSFNKESERTEQPNQFSVSNDCLSEKDIKLVNYLAKHNHKSPFNHAFLSFRVKAPLFVARQLVKHEYLPWNEVSRRYVDDEVEFYFPNTWRARAEDVKQGSGGILSSQQPSMDIDTFVKSECHRSLINYKELLSAGVAPEQARMVLPQNMMTSWIWSGTLFAFVKMLKLRLDPHTQQETQEVAKQISKYVEMFFPASYQALMEN